MSWTLLRFVQKGLNILNGEKRNVERVNRGPVWSEKRIFSKVRKWDWSIWNSSGFANWCLLRLGFYSPMEDERQGPYPQVSTRTNSKFLGILDFSQAATLRVARIILEMRPCALRRNYVSVCWTLYGPRLNLVEKRTQGSLGKVL